MAFTYRPQSARRAFTLVEALVVVLLIGVLAGAMVVQLRGRREAQALRLEAADLASALRFAAAEARLRGRPHRLRLSEGMRCYVVERQTPDGNAYEPADGRAGRWRRLADGVCLGQITGVGSVLQPAPTSLVFGAGDEDFSGRVEVWCDDGEHCEIEVHAQTAQVRVVP